MEAEAQSQTRVAEFSSGQATKPRRTKPPWENKMTSRDLDVWNDKYNPDPKIYLASIPSDEATFESLRGDRANVHFYVSQFENGLRLPLDPFLCEFLEATNSVPCELALNTIRVVMSFITSCRLLGLEPRLNVLCHYFVFTLGFDRVLAKHRNNFIKVITDFPSKDDKWCSKGFVVESTRGWSFRAPKGTCRSIPVVPNLVGDDARLRDRLNRFLGVQGKLSSKNIVWKTLFTDESYLIRAGVSSVAIAGVDPLCKIEPSTSLPDWELHRAGRFKEKCPDCQGINGTGGCFTAKLEDVTDMVNVRRVDARRANRSTVAADRSIELEKARVEAEEAGTAVNPPTMVAKNKEKVAASEPEAQLSALRMKRPRNSASKSKKKSKLIDEASPEHGASKIRDSGSSEGTQGGGDLPEHTTELESNAPDSAVGKLQCPWLGSDFKMPEEKIEVEALGDLIGAVPLIENIDVSARDGYAALVGTGLVTRIISPDLAADMETESTRLLLGRIGCCYSEGATVAQKLADRVIANKNARDQAEKKLSKSEARVKALESDLAKSRKLVSRGKVEIEARGQRITQLVTERDDFQQQLAASQARETKLEEERAKLEEERVTFNQIQADMMNELKLAKAASSRAVEDYKKTPDFENDCYAYFVDGRFHVLRVLAGYGVGVGTLVHFGDTDMFSEVARAGSELVPFSTEELTNIAKDDADEGRDPWFPPAPRVPDVRTLLAYSEKDRPAFDPKVKIPPIAIEHDYLIEIKKEKHEIA